MMLIINKASDPDDDENHDENHLSDMTCARVTMLIHIGPMTEYKYFTLQVFTSKTYITINNYITTNKLPQLLLLVIFLMRCSATSSTMLSTRAGAPGARARARARATSRFLL